MVIDPTDSPALSPDALHVARRDRAALARHIDSQTLPFNLLQAACMAVLVAIPAAGISVVTFFLLAGVSFAFVGVEALYRKRVGVAISLPAGVGSWLVITLLAMAIVGLVVVSLVLAVLDLRGWIALTAAAGALVGFVGVAIYDRVYASDLQASIGSTGVEGATVDAPAWFRLLAFLRPLTNAGVPALERCLDGVHDVSGELENLADAGLVSSSGAGTDRSVSLTRAGRRLFDAHLDAMRP